MDDQKKQGIREVELHIDSNFGDTRFFLQIRNNEKLKVLFPAKLNHILINFNYLSLGS